MQVTWFEFIQHVWRCTINSHQRQLPINNRVYTEWIKLVNHALVNMKSVGNKNNSQAGDSVNGQKKQPDLLQWQIYRNVLLEETDFWHHAAGKMCYLESQSPIYQPPKLSFRKFSNDLQQQGRLGTVPLLLQCVSLHSLGQVCCLQFNNYERENLATAAYRRPCQALTQTRITATNPIMLSPTTIALLQVHCWKEGWCRLRK